MFSVHTRPKVGQQFRSEPKASSTKTFNTSVSNHSKDIHQGHAAVVLVHNLTWSLLMDRADLVAIETRVQYILRWQPRVENGHDSRQHFNGFALCVVLQAPMTGAL